MTHLLVVQEQPILSALYTEHVHWAGHTPSIVLITRWLYERMRLHHCQLHELNPDLADDFSELALAWWSGAPSQAGSELRHTFLVVEQLDSPSSRAPVRRLEEQLMLPYGLDIRERWIGCCCSCFMVEALAALEGDQLPDDPGLLVDSPAKQRAPGLVEVPLGATLGPEDAGLIVFKESANFVLNAQATYAWTTFFGVEPEAHVTRFREQYRGSEEAEGGLFRYLIRPDQQREG